MSYTWCSQYTEPHTRYKLLHTQPLLILWIQTIVIVQCSCTATHYPHLSPPPNCSFIKKKKGTNILIEEVWVLFNVMGEKISLWLEENIAVQCWVQSPAFTDVMCWLMPSRLTSDSMADTPSIPMSPLLVFLYANYTVGILTVKFDDIQKFRSGTEYWITE